MSRKKQLQGLKPAEDERKLQTSPLFVFCGNVGSIFQNQNESAYLYKNIFGELEDKNSEYWENFEQADDFIAFYKEVKESTRDEKFKTDIQTLLDTLEMAAKNHDMMQANAIFKILHDMDYFLLRYGIEDVGQYTKNDGMVRKYYGVLAMYDGRISN